MKILTLILFIASILQISTSQETCATANTKLGYFKCTFEYTACSQTTKIELNYCEEEYCRLYNFLPNGPSCVWWSKRNLTQATCIKSCCDNPAYTQFTIDTMSQCLASDQRFQQIKFTIGIILISVLVPVFILIVILVYCRQKLPCRRLRGDSESDSQSKSQANLQFDKLIWTQKDKVHFVRQQDSCSICLSSKINCSTGCKHVFHLNCLIQWTNKNYKCPNCNKIDINPLVLECETCRMNQAQYYIKQGTKVILNDKKIQCNTCQSYNPLQSQKYLRQPIQMQNPQNHS